MLAAWVDVGQSDLSVLVGRKLDNPHLLIVSLDEKCVPAGAIQTASNANVSKLFNSGRSSPLMSGAAKAEQESFEAARPSD